MSVHDGRPYLGGAVDSILRQSLDDFEFLIIDDASADGSAADLGRLTDPRVRLVRNPQNVGLTRSLNNGLAVATGNYVARMDADDIAAPHRLERQVALLNARPDVGVVGSSRTLIDEAGAFVAHAPAAETDVRIRWKCLLGNPFAHPAVMLRRDVLETHRLRYDETFRTAQDYDLWSRLLAVTRGHNLPEPLLSYRLRNGVSRVLKPEQLRNHDRIAHASIRRLAPGFEISPDEVTQLRGRFGGHSVREPGMDPADPWWVEKYLALLDAFVAPFREDPEAAALRTEVRAQMPAAARAVQGTPPLPSRRG
jgi:glycosyltransferase involved in cell wall biosynthesis